MSVNKDFFQPERDFNQRRVSDYLESEQGEGAGQRASEKRRGQPFKAECSERVADPDSR